MMKRLKMLMLDNLKALLALEGPMLRGTLAGFAWVIPLAILAAKAAQKWAANRSAKKKGQAANEAEKKRVEGAQENRRAKMAGVQSMIQGVSKGLAGGGYGPSSGGGYTGGTGGRPNYEIDPAILARMQEAPV